MAINSTSLAALNNLIQSHGDAITKMYHIIPKMTHNLMLHNKTLPDLNQALNIYIRTMQAK